MEVRERIVAHPLSLWASLLERPAAPQTSLHPQVRI